MCVLPGSLDGSITRLFHQPADLVQIERVEALLLRVRRQVVLGDGLEIDVVITNTDDDDAARDALAGIILLVGKGDSDLGDGRAVGRGVGAVDESQLLLIDMDQLGRSGQDAAMGGGQRCVGEALLAVPWEAVLARSLALSHEEETGDQEEGHDNQGQQDNEQSEHGAIQGGSGGGTIALGEVDEVEVHDERIGPEEELCGVRGGAAGCGGIVEGIMAGYMPGRQWAAEVTVVGFVMFCIIHDQPRFSSRAGPGLPVVGRVATQMNVPMSARNGDGQNPRARKE